jgi:hypothetical protein
MEQPYRVSYKLIRREARAAGEASTADFQVPVDPTAIAIDGEGTANAARDVLVAALRELARTRR